MALELHTTYSEWRSAYAWPSFLREDGLTPPPERLLQAIWFHQRLRRDQLCTTDGRRLQVLHPGFWNREAGPDFKRAILQWPGETAREGDIEIDLHPSGWRSHGHASNPGYANVILHVIWKSNGRETFPTLELAGQLETSVEKLEHWHNSERAARWPTELAGQCRTPLRALSSDEQLALLREAATTRFHVKAARMALRASAVGWDQTLWEFVFRALGYKQNIWPMQRLGELVPSFWSSGDSSETLLAKLLGIAGLLPPSQPIESTPWADYQRRLLREWEGARTQLEEHALPRSLWHLHHLRPANHPQRRLALASHWLSRSDLSQRVQQWIHIAPPKPRDLCSSLRDSLEIPRDSLWERHWTFRAASFEGSRPLLGDARLSDIAMNVFLPWVWGRVGTGPSGQTREEVERRYFAWPQAQDNATLKLARDRLLSGDRNKCSLRKAAMQQGLLQIVSDFCEHSDALCRQCPFPGWVDEWRS